MHDAGVPVGVFNLVNGEGPEVGAALATHPDVDMISITGSTRAGVLVAQAAAPTVKRVAQELGGKLPHVILPDADFARAIPAALDNVNGGYDYLLRIVVPSVVSFQELMERLLQSDIGIEKFTSRIVLRQSSEKRIYSLSLIAAPRGGIGSYPVNHRHATSDNLG